VPKLQPITASRHSGLRWTRNRDFRFAAQDTAVPLILQELGRIAVDLPIAFVPAGESFVPVALLGIEPGRNACVDVQGRWIADCLPELLRSHPFALAPIEDGRQVLCIDEEVESHTGSETGEPLFDADGKPTERLVRIRDRLAQRAAGREAARRVGALLASHKLIQPWPLRIKDGDNERGIDGLYRIDEAALDALPAEALGALRSSGALPMAYGQLLSMYNLRKLAAYARRTAMVGAAASAAAADEIDLDLLERGGTLGGAGDSTPR
jgi:hypothetical protein